MISDALFEPASWTLLPCDQKKYELVCFQKRKQKDFSVSGLLSSFNVGLYSHLWTSVRQVLCSLLTTTTQVTMVSLHTWAFPFPPDWKCKKDLRSAVAGFRLSSSSFSHSVKLWTREVEANFLKDSSTIWRSLDEWLDRSLKKKDWTLLEEQQTIKGGDN